MKSQIIWTTFFQFHGIISLELSASHSKKCTNTVSIQIAAKNLLVCPGLPVESEEMCVCVWQLNVDGCIWIGTGGREGGGTQNSECFIVKGHLTHYKWYDYKHAHTTYTKQLTKNTKQTDKTKKKQKKETNMNKKKTKQNDMNKNQHPPPPPRKKKQQSIHDVDDIQVIQTKSKHCHIWLNTHCSGGEGGGNPYTFIFAPK